MKHGTSPMTQSHHLETDFFDGGDALRMQVERACGNGPGDGVGPLSRVEAGKAYSFLMATAERVFSHAVLSSFLNRLRGWGMEKLGTRHASTPQIHIYVEGCARAMVPDATPAAHHYLYSLTRTVSAHVQILTGNGSERKWLEIGLNRLSTVRLDFNNLLVHRTDLAYAVQGPRKVKNTLGGAIFLHGYIW